MKFNFKHNLELKAEIAKQAEDKKNKKNIFNWVVVLAFSFSIAFILCIVIAVKINIDFRWTNNPQVIQKAEK